MSNRQLSSGITAAKSITADIIMGTVVAKALPEDMGAQRSADAYHGLHG